MNKMRGIKVMHARKTKDTKKERVRKEGKKIRGNPEKRFIIYIMNPMII